MLLNTKTLFISILKSQRADCVCDIGSRDGDQSLLFRHLLPQATIFAFEANPINFEAMNKRPNLAAERIQVLPFAISNQRGVARFHIADVDYNDPSANRGTSSLLESPSERAKEVVTVETHRIDEFIAGRCPDARQIGLWIDVEGAEYAVLEGIRGIEDRVVAVHVETTNEPRWVGQKQLSEISQFMSEVGFVLCGRNYGDGPSEWGDVVFLRQDLMRRMKLAFFVCRLKARASYWLRVDNIAVWLKTRLPWLYRLLRRLYIRFGT